MVEEGETAATESLSAVTQESFEREELDYDEDDDEEHKEERTGRFTSERNQNSTPPTTNAISRLESRRQVDNNKNPTQNQRQWQNGSRGNGRGRGNRGQRFRNGPNIRGNGTTPTLMSIPSGPPPLLALNTQPMFGAPPPGGKILINPNFRGPMGPPGALGPTNVLPPVAGRPSVMQSVIPGQAGPIIPRLPNGIPLTGLPSNHGVAGFGPPVHHNRPTMPPPVIPAGPLSVNEALEEGTDEVRRIVATAAIAVDHGALAVLAPDRPLDDDGIIEAAVAVEVDRAHRGNEMAAEISVECAKAVGLDNDYLSKLEDQRRKRDEVLRRKEQRRFGGNEQQSSNSRSNDYGGSRQNQQRDRRPAETGGSSGDYRRGGGGGGGGSGSTSQSGSRQLSEAETALKKNKAYLCVNVKNIKQLTTAKMRVETLAKDLGEIRKCWKSNEDQVTVIFVEHAKAKEFMLKYNNKVLSGLRIQVSLEKAYLNLADIQA
ncbi:unnamed protein product [Nippostrongylus brasiliensis]|uniref:RRM domain-containing protein n=1 Tax=Nippostrongylus brasiliensis TaxID=27835 RepID=A0A0N4YPH6_NIPBR|nr:unnamed protein product [Nippostrongylus brasiliensis]